MSEEKRKLLKKHPDPLINDVFDVLEHDLDRSRELVVTPFGGNYGTTAGYVIAVNGSPPKGVLFVQNLNYANPTLILNQHGKVKEIKYAAKGYFQKVRTIRDFLKRFEEETENKKCNHKNKFASDKGVYCNSCLSWLYAVFCPNCEWKGLDAVDTPCPFAMCFLNQTKLIKFLCKPMDKKSCSF
jgi:hypothetical protein